jgi:hypothetical protein
METTDNQAYQPGVDQNQGVVGTMARAEQTATLDPETIGASQEEGLSPNASINAMLPSPEPDITDAEADTSGGMNDDLLVEKALEAGEIDVEGDENDRDIDGL